MESETLLLHSFIRLFRKFCKDDHPLTTFKQYPERNSEFLWRAEWVAGNLGKSQGLCSFQPLSLEGIFSGNWGVT
jgi:hypothetical protein